MSKLMRWIPVKEKLPRANVEVIVWVFFEGRNYGVFTDSCKYSNQGSQDGRYKDQYSNAYWQMGSATNYKVTHWMQVTPP